MGLGTGQDVCVGSSHLCRIAEVQPNDPQPSCSPASPDPSVRGFSCRGFSGEEKGSVHCACISIMERKVPIGKVPRSVIGDRHSATVRVTVALVQSALVVERETVADQGADHFAAVRNRSAPQGISVIP
jgi:hypothetical protein